MNSTTITTTSTEKFNQTLSILHSSIIIYHSSIHLLPSPTTNSITFFTNSTLQTNTILSKLTKLLHLTPLQPSYALAA